MPHPCCTKCNGTGLIGVSTRTLRYRGPGPVPEDARGVFEVKCNACPDEGDEDGMRERFDLMHKPAEH